MNLLKIFMDTVLENKLIEKNDVLIVGFSGGPDSVFLTEMLLKFRRILPFDIVLVHINHMLRSEAANRDEEFTHTYAKENSIKSYSSRIDVTKIAKDKGLSLEEAGREARYKFYNDIYVKELGTKIVLAHNKDDQIETFLFRMIRGTSLEGLEGIKTIKNNIIRPIIEIYKKDILEYLDGNSIKYMIDDTNFENDFTRNSIRLDLIPFIEKRYNISFKEKIFSLMEEIRDTNKETDISLEAYCEDNKLVISKLKELSSYYQKKLINKFLIKNLSTVSRNKIEEVMKILRKQGFKQINLSKDMFLKKDYDYIYISKNIEKDEKQNIKEVQFKVPGKIVFSDYTIEAEIFNGDISALNIENNELYTNIAPESIITIRTRQKGDRFIPLGMSNEKSIKDIFINEKVSKEKRDKIPLFINENKIFWIAEVKRSNNFLYNKNTTGIKIKVRRTI